MSRPTLKLPTLPDGNKIAKTPGRKPIRGASKTSKASFSPSKPSPKEFKENTGRAKSAGDTPRQHERSERPGNHANIESDVRPKTSSGDRAPIDSNPTRPERTVGNFTNGGKRIEARKEQAERHATLSARSLSPAGEAVTENAHKRNEPKRFGKERDKDRPQKNPDYVRTTTTREPDTARTINTNEGVAAPFLPPKNNHNELPRLSKVMSEQGLCSRREADEWIENGWVRVDGQIIKVLGTRVSPSVHIEINPTASKHQTELATILINKPIGYVSGQAEDGYQPASVLILPENQWEEGRMDRYLKNSHFRGLAPAGRLDIDSTGLLVLTQDGRVARRLIGNDSKVEKEYLVRVEGSIDAEGLKRLNNGLSLDGVRLKPAIVSWQNEEQLRFVLREGKKRQIRRMCELVGLNVVGLKRIRIGSINLGKMPIGKWRFLRKDEQF